MRVTFVVLSIRRETANWRGGRIVRRMERALLDAYFPENPRIAHMYRAIKRRALKKHPTASIKQREWSRSRCFYPIYLSLLLPSRAFIRATLTPLFHRPRPRSYRQSEAKWTPAIARASGKRRNYGNYSEQDYRPTSPRVMFFFSSSENKPLSRTVQKNSEIEKEIKPK